MSNPIRKAKRSQISLARRKKMSRDKKLKKKQQRLNMAKERSRMARLQPVADRLYNALLPGFEALLVIRGVRTPSFRDFCLGTLGRVVRFAATQHVALDEASDAFIQSILTVTSMDADLGTSCVDSPYYDSWYEVRAVVMDMVDNPVRRLMTATASNTTTPYATTDAVMTSSLFEILGRSKP